MKDSMTRIPDDNFVASSTAEFVDYYNENVPAVFPRASVKALEKFKEAYPSLFDKSNTWTIDKHRKKLMDWLTSYREVTEQ